MPDPVSNEIKTWKELTWKKKHIYCNVIKLTKNEMKYYKEIKQALFLQKGQLDKQSE